MNQFWDKRYSIEEYVYGKEPNEFFKKHLSNLKPGILLLPGEGEGRNAVFAASNFWEVHAFDPSKEGRKKAMKLAKERGVDLRYTINTYLDFAFFRDFYDAVGLFFTHQPAEMRIPFHKKVINSLKPGGQLIMETFHKKQINRDTGGPGNMELLFDETELRNDFAELELLELNVLTRKLSEGIFHNGEADVIQLVANKVL